MNYKILALLFVAIFASTLRAETPMEREFKQVREQRDKAIAAAVDPINRRYQASLEQLLRRATQASDLETALKIKKEMGTAAAAAKPESPAAGAKTPEEIEAYLTTNVWMMTKDKKPMGELKFNAGGSAYWGKKRTWAVTSKGKVTLDNSELDFAKDMKSFKLVLGGTGGTEFVVIQSTPK